METAARGRLTGFMPIGPTTLDQSYQSSSYISMLSVVVGAQMHMLHDNR